MNNRYQYFRTKQESAHHNLVKTVKKYAVANFLRPIPAHQLEAFHEIDHFAKNLNRPLIIDSGCGTGLSSKKLAESFPDHGVVGIDKSAARLSRTSTLNPENLLLIRGDLIDLWRLLLLAKLPIARHYLFFPNPWPKISHLKRRFYAHPIFKTMISLAPYFELRTNWHIYAEECELAFKTLGQEPALSIKTDKDYMTLFEKKYLESCCPIYILSNRFR